MCLYFKIFSLLKHLTTQETQNNDLSNRYKRYFLFKLIYKLILDEKNKHLNLHEQHLVEFFFFKCQFIERAC